MSDLGLTPRHRPPRDRRNRKRAPYFSKRPPETSARPGLVTCLSCPPGTWFMSPDRRRVRCCPACKDQAQRGDRNALWDFLTELG